ncbi:MAG: LytTR family DNA-binding domain-containing protein [Defluviitaleaceae bacterium]|nr:LytTR family DNA-binding domain-containing protein [Defluviitaleaceae bacterium]
MLRAALCDDAREHNLRMLSLFKEYSDERPCTKIEFFDFDNSEKLLAKVKNGESYDIYFLDIIMPSPNGIELAKKIRETDSEAHLVFITQSESFALDAFRVAASQYIVKPVVKSMLFDVLDKIILAHQKEKGKFFVVTSPGRTVCLMHSSIVVVEKVGRCLRFHLSNGKHVDSIVVRASFGVTIEGLLADERFLHVHQSFAVNMQYVEEMRDRMFLMKNGMRVSIPRPKFADVKQAYLNYIAKISAKPTWFGDADE